MGRGLGNGEMMPQLLSNEASRVIPEKGFPCPHSPVNLPALNSFACRLRTRQPDRARNPVPSGFTLLEVILALALTAVVLYMVTMAVGLHLRVLDAGRTEVEEATLARALLKQIADDIRGAVRYDPIEVESMSSGSGPGGDSSELLDPEPEDDYATEEEAEPAQDIAESTAPTSVPGIVGNSSQIQIDVARLPRASPSRGAVPFSRNENWDSPQIVAAELQSDVKTVAYYVVTPGKAAGAGGLETRSGLIRRELDRSVTSYAAQRGGLLNVELSLEPIAPEVKAIEFRYFDGAEWLDTWDTEAQGRLPAAVEVAVALGRIRHESGGVVSWIASGKEEAEDGQTFFYRLLVDLPAAAPSTDAGAAGSAPPEEAER